MRWKPEHWLSLIAVVGTLAAAIVGAWVGGRIATDGARDLQRDQARREEARELAAARMTARLVVAEMAEISNNVYASGRNGCWLPLDYELDLTPADRRVLAAKLPGREWSALVSWLRWEDILALERRDGFDTRNPARSRDVSVTVEALTRFDRIATLLAKFAGTYVQLSGSPEDAAWVRRLANPRGAYPKPELCDKAER
jgi:hypothetical protein